MCVCVFLSVIMWFDGFFYGFSCHAKFSGLNFFDGFFYFVLYFWGFPLLSGFCAIGCIPNRKTVVLLMWYPKAVFFLPKSFKDLQLGYIQTNPVVSFFFFVRRVLRERLGFCGLKRPVSVLWVLVDGLKELALVVIFFLFEELGL